MKISIISTVYNKEKYLKKHIESLLSQSYKNLEIIFVNDGSTDSSLKILNSYAKNNKKIIIVNQKNVGPSYARRNGLKVSTGELIYFVDSDDSLANSSTISDIVSIFTGNEKIDCVFGKMITEYQNRNQVDKCIYYNKLKPGINDISILQNNCFRGSLAYKIFKKKFIDENCFIDSKAYEDLYTSYSVINNCNNFYYFDRVIYVVNRKNNNSLTCSINLEKIKESFNVIKELKNKCFSFKISLSIMETKVYYDMLHYSLTLNDKSAKELILYLNKIKRNIIFNSFNIKSRHYFLLKIFIVKFENYKSNRKYKGILRRF